MKTNPTNDKLLNFFQRALDINHAVYGLGIDVLAAYSPLLATLIPAYLTYHNTTTYLLFPPWVGWVAAAAVEVLGISAVHTAVSFYQYNQTLTRKGDLRSPFWLALGTAVFYIAIVIIVNTGLDAASGASLVNVIAAGTLSLLSLVGALIIAVRAQHALRLSGNDPATVQKLNEKIQQLNERLQQLNTENRELNGQVRMLDDLVSKLNKQTAELAPYRTLFNESVDAAERIRQAAVLLPNISQNAIAQLVNVSKSYVSQVFSENGFHRTPGEQDALEARGG